MNEKIASQSLAVIREAAPAEEARGIKWSLGRAHEEFIPVDGLLTGVGRDGIDPGAAWRVAIRRTFDEEHIPEGTGCEEFSRLLIDDGTYALAPHLQDAI